MRIAESHGAQVGHYLHVLPAGLQDQTLREDVPHSHFHALIRLEVKVDCAIETFTLGVVEFDVLRPFHCSKRMA